MGKPKGPGGEDTLHSQTLVRKTSNKTKACTEDGIGMPEI
jgi:hypothetical protein